MTDYYLKPFQTSELNHTFRHFTPSARRVLVLAQVAAASRSSTVIYPFHLLLALAANEPGIAESVLRRYNVSPVKVSQYISGFSNLARRHPQDRRLTLSNSTKIAITNAVKVAKEYGHGRVTSLHILIALLRLQNKIVMRVLWAFRVRSSELLERATFVVTVDHKSKKKPARKSNQLQSLFGALRSKISGLMPPSNDELTAQFVELPDEDKQISGQEYAALLEHLGIVNWDERYEHVQTLIKQEDFQTALSEVSEIIRKIPQSPLPYFQRGNLYLKLKEHDKALADYDTYIRLAPKDARVYRYRYDVFKTLNQTDKGIEDLTAGLRQHPHNVDILALRANLYLSSRNFDESVADATEVLNVDPKRRNTLHNRGTANVYKGDLGAAELDFQEILRLYPDAKYTHSNLGWLALTRKNYDDAIQFCAEEIRLHPENGAAYYSLGAAHAAKGNPQEAVANYRLSLQHWKTVHQPLTEHIAQEMETYITQWGDKTE